MTQFITLKMNFKTWLLASAAVCARALNVAKVRTARRNALAGVVFPAQTQLIRQPKSRVFQRLHMSSSSSNDIQNPMNPNLYTEKAWDAVAKSPQYCEKYSTQYVEAPLLLKALLEEGPTGLTQRIMIKAGVDMKTFDTELEGYLLKQPKVSDTTNKMMGKSMEKCLTKSMAFKKEFGDSFISIEHLLLAMTDIDGFVKDLFKKSKVDLTKLKEAVSSIRGKNTVTSRNPEVSYEALQKYGRDLTAAAREGKLDPVIGRDDEIRRTIQILSRRTKNK